MKDAGARAEVPEATRGERLFFALWPEAPVRAALAVAAKGVCSVVRGRPVRHDNLHVTLVFLGDVDAAVRRCAEAAADGVGGEAFELHLDRIGFFPRAGVLWLGAEGAPPALLATVRSLGERLESCGVRPERRPFRAHVTLMRKVRHARRGTLDAPVRWPVSSFALVRSELGPEGARYEVLRTWPLRPAGR